MSVKTKEMTGRKAMLRLMAYVEEMPDSPKVHEIQERFIKAWDLYNERAHSKQQV